MAMGRRGLGVDGILGAIASFRSVESNIGLELLCKKDVLNRLLLTESFSQKKKMMDLSKI